MESLIIITIAVPVLIYMAIKRLAYSRRLGFLRGTEEGRYHSISKAEHIVKRDHRNANLTEDQMDRIINQYLREEL